MAVTEEDWKASLKTVTPPRGRSSSDRAETLLRQAAVEARLLTGQPAWDHYLERLQVLVDEAQAQLTTWREKINGAYSDADLRMVQLQVNIYQERLQVLTHCMTLPKEILNARTTTLDMDAN